MALGLGTLILQYVVFHPPGDQASFLTISLYTKAPDFININSTTLYCSRQVTVRPRWRDGETDITSRGRRCKGFVAQWYWPETCVATLWFRPSNWGHRPMLCRSPLLILLSKGQRKNMMSLKTYFCSMGGDKWFPYMTLDWTEWN